MHTVLLVINPNVPNKTILNVFLFGVIYAGTPIDCLNISSGLLMLMV